MKRYTVTAIFKVRKELTILVPDNADPCDESKWGDIEHESDVDCWLYDVEGAEQNEEE